jgi:type I restriction enzyme S subunit
MRSSYKRIGDYIQLVDERNRDLSIETLLGLSIDKIFIPSVANTVGSNMANYKVIRKGQFACSLMQVRRDKKIPVAMQNDYNEAIISQAYPVFEIKNTDDLLPEYLMMWMSRSEFDREACFYAVGGVRGSLEWEDFCNMELPVPTIEKQREIVREYHTIVDRIKLNEQLNQKLEETAQAIYKQWFVDFEFPMSKEHAAEIGKPELEGKPYKSSGGKMVWNDELDQEIPEGWECANLGTLIKTNPENYNAKKDKFREIHYLDTGSITNNRMDKLQMLKLGQDTIPSRAKRKIKHNDIVYSTVRPNLRHFGLIKNPPPNMLVSTGFVVIRSKKEHVSNELILCWLSNDQTIDYFHSKAEMSVSTYPSIKPEDIEELLVPVPKERELKHFNKVLVPIFNRLSIDQNEQLLLGDLSLILHQKMTKAEATA